MKNYDKDAFKEIIEEGQHITIEEIEYSYLPPIPPPVEKKPIVQVTVDEENEEEHKDFCRKRINISS